MVEPCRVPPCSESRNSLQSAGHGRSLPPDGSRDLVRQEGMPWVRLVLSLLLLGAPALALAIDTVPDGPYLAGAFDQPTRGGSHGNGIQKGIHLQLVRQSQPLAQAVMVATPWRVARLQLNAVTRTLTQVHRWVQVTPFSHGRVIDPAQYLQRTLR